MVLVPTLSISPRWLNPNQNGGGTWRWTTCNIGGRIGDLCRYYKTSDSFVPSQEVSITVFALVMSEFSLRVVLINFYRRDNYNILSTVTVTSSFQWISASKHSYLLYGKVVLREIWTIDWIFLGLKFAILTVSMVISCVLFDFESWKIQNNDGPRAIK